MKLIYQRVCCILSACTIPCLLFGNSSANDEIINENLLTNDASAIQTPLGQTVDDNFNQKIDSAATDLQRSIFYLLQALKNQQ